MKQRQDGQRECQGDGVVGAERGASSCEAVRRTARASALSVRGHGKEGPT